MNDLVDESAPEVQDTPTEATQDAPAEADDLITKGASEDDSPAPAPATWPDDWRSQMAGDDAKVLKLAERYNSPADVMTALRAAQQKLSSGEYKSGPPEDAAALAEWRKEAGIPEKASDYDLNDLGNGLVIGEDDKPIIDHVLEAMHSQNATPEQVKSTVAAYYQAQEQMLNEQAEIDKADQTSTEDALRAEWGNEYRGNMNQLKGFLDSAPDGLGQLLLTGRLGNGKGIANDEAAVKWLLNTAKEINPMGTVVPAGGDPSAKVSSEIADIEKTMRDDPDAYWKDDAKQKRYAELLEYQSKYE